MVSARVAAFERRLRTPLLHRTTRKLSLTREGIALYERCARVAAAADDAAAAADRTGDAPHGLLRVDAPIVFAQEHLAAPAGRATSRNIRRSASRSPWTTG